MGIRQTSRPAGAVFWSIFAAFAIACLSVDSQAQSSDQAFPTAVTENQLSGRIGPRDIGDSRLTTYYFTFNGDQGDVFVNVVTRNLTGSIDIFTADGLRPLTKILVYADVSQSETGRVIYLRKREKLILRIEGRTPNDDAAEFVIKFAGSFVAAVPQDAPPVPKVSDKDIATESGVRVNSVGTIIEVIPKPKPSPKGEPPAETVAKTEPEPAVTPQPNVDEPKPEVVDESNRKPEKPSEPPASKKEEPKSTPPASPKPAPRRARARTTPPSTRKTEPKTNEDQPKSAPPEKPTDKPPEVVVTDNTRTPEANPLANVRLVIVFKDGRKVERPMTEVLRFTADQTTLTIVSRNGRIAKFPILDVSSVTIQ